MDKNIFNKLKNINKKIFTEKIQIILINLVLIQIKYK